MNPNKTLVMVATYNEIENLPLLVEEIHRHAPEADILVIDDNSPDGIGRWVDRKGTEDPRLQCLHRSARRPSSSSIARAANRKSTSAKPTARCGSSWLWP